MAADFHKHLEGKQKCHVKSVERVYCADEEKGRQKRKSVGEDDVEGRLIKGSPDAHIADVGVMLLVPAQNALRVHEAMSDVVKAVVHYFEDEGHGNEQSQCCRYIADKLPVTKANESGSNFEQRNDQHIDNRLACFFIFPLSVFASALPA